MLYIYYICKADNYTCGNAINTPEIIICVPLTATSIYSGCNIWSWLMIFDYDKS